MAAAGSAALARLLGEARAVTVFTGVGISIECGVPDYRSPGNPWRIHAPLGFKDDLYAGARPGRRHRAVARWAAAGLVRAVVTQNIDGLHGAAGGLGDEIVELHERLLRALPRLRRPARTRAHPRPLSRGRRAA